MQKHLIAFLLSTGSARSKMLQDGSVARGHHLCQQCSKKLRFEILFAKIEPAGISAIHTYNT